MIAAGIILCGGNSMRMGQPKALLPFGDEALLSRVVRLLQEAVEPVVVVAARGQQLPPLPRKVRVVRDEVQGKGPLAGLAAGLAALEGIADAAYVSSCDAPLLRTAFVQRVVSFLASGADQLRVAVPFVRERLHPLAAAYTLSVLPAVREQLAAERLKMHDLLELVSTRRLASEELIDTDPQLDSLRNVNTPQDYQSTLQMFRSSALE